MNGKFDGIDLEYPIGRFWYEFARQRMSYFEADGILKFDILRLLNFNIMKNFYAMVVLTIFGCSGTNNIESDYTDQLEAITQVRNDHVKAVNTTDLDLVLKDMSPDIVYLAPTLKPIIGIEALRDFVAPLYKEISPKIEMIPHDVKLQDSIAVEWGIINGEVSYKSSDSSSSFTYNYVFVYEMNADGKWLITRDIYN